MLSRKRVIVLLLALALVLPAATSALAAKTQFNVAPGDFVTLVFDFTAGDFFRVDQQGKLGTKPFSIPSNKTLVITDVAWTFDGGTSNTTVGLQLNLNRSGNENQVFVASTVVNPDGGGGLNQHLTGGLVLTSGGSAKVVPSFSGVVNSKVLILQGYLS